MRRIEQLPKFGLDDDGFSTRGSIDRRNLARLLPVGHQRFDSSHFQDGRFDRCLSSFSLVRQNFDDPETALKVVAYARKMRPDLHIIARAYDRVHVYKLYKAGANDIVRELFDSSLRAGRYVLERMGLTDFEAARAEEVFYHHDRDAVRQLAELWDPDIPPSQNQAYIDRAKSLEKQLEFALSALEEEERQRA